MLECVLYPSPLVVIMHAVAWSLWKAAGYATGLIGKNHCSEQEEDLALFDVWNAFTHGRHAEGPQTWAMDWFLSPLIFAISPGSH